MYHLKCVFTGEGKGDYDFIHLSDETVQMKRHKSAAVNEIWICDMKQCSWLWMKVYEMKLPLVEDRVWSSGAENVILSDSGEELTSGPADGAITPEIPPLPPSCARPWHVSTGLRASRRTSLGQKWSDGWKQAGVRGVYYSLVNLCLHKRRPGPWVTIDDVILVILNPIRRRG